MESKIGLLIQFSGIVLVTVSSLFIRRSIASPAARYWSAGWLLLSISLGALSFGLLYSEVAKPLFFIYFVGEYAFGVLLLLGCYAISGNTPPSLTSPLVVVPLFMLGLVLTLLESAFQVVFHLHAFVIGLFFALSFRQIGKMKDRTLGWRTVRVGLFVLAADFFHYFALYVFGRVGIEITIPPEIATFNPVVDLVFEVILAFGMAILLLEQVLDEVRQVNDQLREAHKKLEKTAFVDSLTTALNRHAFYGYVHNPEAADHEYSGCVGFFDIDDLKPINDNYGHAVGDLAIRAVVRSIRELLRAEDLIYRWGGDEFFVLLVSMDEEMARARMASLERKLTGLPIDGLDTPLTVRVSYGFANFENQAAMDGAIKRADEAMYAEKRRRKEARREDAAIMPPEFGETDRRLPSP